MNVGRRAAAAAAAAAQYWGCLDKLHAGSCYVATYAGGDRLLVVQGSAQHQNHICPDWAYFPPCTSTQYANYPWVPSQTLRVLKYLTRGSAMVLRPLWYMQTPIVASQRCGPRRPHHTIAVVCFVTTAKSRFRSASHRPGICWKFWTGEYYLSWLGHPWIISKTPAC